MTQQSDSDSDTTIHRRNYLKYLGACGFAAAAAPAAQRNAAEKAKEKGKALTEDDDEEDEEEEAEDETPEAEIRVEDFTFEESADSVLVQEYEANSGGYISIHDYSRFEFAEGEDPADYDVPIPTEREFPVCESLIGITDFLPAGEYEDVEVPLYGPDAPAVELGVAEEGAELEVSQPLVAIPHNNTTDPDDFVCPDDPNTPSDPEEFDGAFGEGSKDTETIPVVHDLFLAICEEDGEETKEVAERAADLIREGVLVPQPVSFGDDDEDEEEDEAGQDVDEHTHDHDH